MLRRRAAALPPGAAPGVPELVCASICYQTFWGLAYLHYEQRLHRDIKPGNILLSSNGEAKLSDFGIARDVDDDIEQLGIDEKARGVEYKKEKERLSALSVAEQDKIFWAKFGMTGPPPRST